MPKYIARALHMHYLWYESLYPDAAAIWIHAFWWQCASICYSWLHLNAVLYLIINILNKIIHRPILCNMHFKKFWGKGWIKNEKSNKRKCHLQCTIYPCRVTFQLTHLSSLVLYAGSMSYFVLKYTKISGILDTVLFKNIFSMSKECNYRSKSFFLIGLLTLSVNLTWKSYQELLFFLFLAYHGKPLFAACPDA